MRVVNESGKKEKKTCDILACGCVINDIYNHIFKKDSFVVFSGFFEKLRKIEQIFEKKSETCEKQRNVSATQEKGEPLRKNNSSEILDFR